MLYLVAHKVFLIESLSTQILIVGQTLGWMARAGLFLTGLVSAT